ncbi:MAG: hypothetical protein BM564_09385, partial [Bacteroidetes bacterium MedPE-SWsnd-G2]
MEEKRTISQFKPNNMNAILRQQKCIIVILIALFSNGYNLFGQVSYTDFSAGAAIIDVGNPNQTENNALKPYGLVFDLVENGIPVHWIIKPNKSFGGTTVDNKVDEADIVITGSSNSNMIAHDIINKECKTGPFLIASEYVEIATPILNSWISNNNGLTVYWNLIALSDIPVYGTLTSFPNIVIYDNGSDTPDIVDGFYDRAGIDTGYSLGTPGDLSQCDEFYVLSHHTDPYDVKRKPNKPISWTQQDTDNLYNFVVNGGNVWMGCHDVSLTETAIVTTSGQRLNFLSQEGLIPYADLTEVDTYVPWLAPYDAIGGYDDNNIVEKHNNTFNNNEVHYNSDTASHPFMQFYGNIEPALNGNSEHVYIPFGLGWNTETYVGLYDNGENDPRAEDLGAIVVYGHAFGNSSYGEILYTGSHISSSNDGTNAQWVGESRLFGNFLLKSALGSAMNLDVLGLDAISNIECVNANIAVNTTVTGGLGELSYSWESEIMSGTANNVTFSSHTTPNPSIQIPSTVEETTIYKITLTVTDTPKDGCTTPKTAKFITTITVYPEPEITYVVTHNSCKDGNNGVIEVNITGGLEPYDISWTGPNNFTSDLDVIKNLESGIYSITVLDSNNCSALAEPLDIEITSTDVEAPNLVAPSNVTIEGCELTSLTGLEYSTTPVEITIAQLEAGIGGNGSVKDDLGIETITYQDYTNSNCPIVITRTFIATDGCNNKDEQIQIITIEDSLPPTLDTTAFDFTIECNGDNYLDDLNSWLNNNGNAYAYDNCSAVIWTNNFTSLNMTCGIAGSTDVTFTASDACGNSVSTTATFTIEDNLAPNLVGLPSYISNEQPSCVDIPVLSFQNYIEESGDGNNSTFLEGEVFRFTDIASGIDALLTIVATVNTTVPMLDDNSNGVDGLKPRSAFSLDHTGDQAYTEYRIDFVETGTSTPSELPQFIATFNDIDGNSNYGEQNWTQNTTNYTLENPTDLSMSEEGSWLVATAGYVEYPGVTNSNPQANISTLNQNTTSFSFRLGVISRNGARSGNGRQHSVEFSCINGNFNNPSTVSDQITVECNDLEDAETVTAIDDCSEATVVFTEIRTDGDCENNYTLERTWTATDLCGNELSRTLTINVVDTTLPSFTVPSDVTINCTEDELNLDLTGHVTDESDNGCEIPVPFESSYTDVITPGSCEGNYIITRTWSLTDSCGNTFSEDQIIEVIDTEAPSFSMPQNVTIQCDGDLDNLSQTGQPFNVLDNCDSNVTVDYEDTVVNGTCNFNYEVKREWTVSDACGNSTTAIQTITIEDTEAPIFEALPSESTQECGSDLNFVDPVVSDNCDSKIDLKFVDTIVDGDCPNSYSVTRTWSATDDCGNTSNAIQIINIEDTQAPIFESLPSEETVNCEDGFVFQQAVVSDECSNSIQLTFNDVSTGDSCEGSYSVIRTWTAIDDCNNTSTATQTFIIIDTTAPVFENLPLVSNLQCDEEIVFAEPSATDNCAKDVTFSFVDETIPGTCEGNYTIIRTWTAADDCGNEAISTHTINVSDSTNPIISGLPTGIILECTDKVDFDTPTATDNCSTNVQLSFEDSTIDGDCKGSYTMVRTWTAIDDCGNSTTASQSITIQDSTPPVGTIPQGENNSELCLDDALIAYELDTDYIASLFTDNCSQSVIVNPLTTIINGDNCNWEIHHDFEVLDDCGNSTGDYKISYFGNDATTPEIAPLPEDRTIECNETVEFTQATASDNCTADVTLTFEDVTTDSSCEGAYSITRTWTATDACGNSSTATQTINLEDTTAPVIAVLPEASTIECNETVEFTQATATDNCTADVTLTFEDVTTDGNCEGAYSITRAWTATDACGNSSTATQTINVEDTIAPVIDTLPEASTIECNETVEFAQATAIDNCATDVTLTFEDVTTDGSCEGSYSITRTWTATDACGNSSIATQTINLEDTTAPILNMPIDIVVECDNIPDMETPTATDNCDSNVTINFIHEKIIPGDCDNSYVIFRTWEAIDSCGNSVVASHTTSIQDTTDPILITGATDIELECDSDNFSNIEDWLNNNGGAEASDNCGAITWTNSFSTMIQDCTSPIAVIFTATDECGNFVETTATYFIQDTTAPVIDTLPEASTIECNETVEFAQATAIDNCSADVTLTFEDVTTDGSCEGSYSITRTWTATDACGNSSTATQTINVEDTTAPVIAALSETSTIECNETVEFAQATATDNCNADVTLTFEDLTTEGSCEGSYSITRTWTATDACGNSSTATQTINVEDTTAPVINTLPEASTIVCNETVEFAQATATDNCAADVTLTFEDVTTDGSCEGAYSITRTWTATDACGNSSTATQTINVKDTTAPVIDTLPEASTIECNETAEFAQATATDNCAADVTLTFEDVST